MDRPPAAPLPVVPIDALFGEYCGPNFSADPRAALHAAAVIIGVDVMSGREFLVYGRPLLEEIQKSGMPRPLAVFKVGLDEDTDELEKLIALVQVVKGRHDYDA
jgi:hypothetical protein